MHTSINGLDNSMDNSKMAMLSMEPRKQITTLHNNSISSLIRLAVGILLNSRNAATASKLDVACVTNVLKLYKLF